MAVFEKETAQGAAGYKRNKMITNCYNRYDTHRTKDCQDDFGSKPCFLWKLDKKTVASSFFEATVPCHMYLEFMPEQQSGREENMPVAYFWAPTSSAVLTEARLH